MLSSEARQVVVVVVAFAAGAALAWVPLSSPPPPFLETSMFPVWGFLIATVCASCPIVWSHGRRALAQLPARRPLMLEALGYGVGAVALIVANKVLIPRAFSHGRGVEALPYISERFTIVYLAVALAVAPSIIAMFRIGDAITALTSGNAGQIAVLRSIGLSVGRDSGRHPVHSGEWPRLVMRQSLWRTSRFQYKSVLGSHDPWKPVGEYGEEQRVNLRRRGWVVP